MQVLDVIDGDTIDVSFDNGAKERIRYIGIDTPEEGELCSSEATNYNKTLVGEKQLTLIQDSNDRDAYGRLLRYACIDDIFINGQIVSSGYAKAVAYPPDIQYADFLESLEDEAKNFKRGCLWTNSGSNNESNGGSNSGNNDGSSNSNGCCRKCITGKPCGDSCISRDKDCNIPQGCACWG